MIAVSDSNVMTFLPYRFSGAAGDSLATTWNNSSRHPGVEFHYVTAASGDLIQGSGATGAVNTTGFPFSDLGSVPLSALALHHTAGEAAPSILFTYSQSPNSVSILHGADLATLSVTDQRVGLATSVLTFPYAGDANGDGQDEVGFYSVALNKSAATRHLHLIGCDGSKLKDAVPIVDIASSSENFRAMSLNYLGGSSDRRRQAKRRDLITLVEDPAGGTSRLLIRRANLNFTAF